MNLDIKAHEGHRLVYIEKVRQHNAMEWKDGQPKIQGHMAYKDEVEDSQMYCQNCDVFVTGWDASVL